MEVAHPLRQKIGAAHTYSDVHFALNFVNVLILKAIARSQRISTIE